MQEIAAIFAGLVPADLTVTLGPDLVERERQAIDPVALDRLERTECLSASAYIGLSRKLDGLAASVPGRLAGLDALVQPTSPLCAVPVSELQHTDAALAYVGRVLSLTRIANAYGLTACSVPGRAWGHSAPVGIDISGPHGADRRVLELASSLENVLMPGPA